MKKTIVAIIVILCLGLTTLSTDIGQAFCPGSEWSDDFNDGNIDGWTVQGYNTTDNPPTQLPGNFTADDYSLRAYDDGTNQAYRTSIVAYGSWEFDLHSVPTTNNHSYIAFVSGPAVEITGSPGWEASVPYEYGIAVVNGQFASFNNTFVLYRRNQGNLNIIPLGQYHVNEMTGWHKVNITRNLEGNFEVYFNNTLGITAVEDTYPTSEIFSFYTLAGYALDNIVVEPHPGLIITTYSCTTTSTSTTTSSTTTPSTNGGGQLPDMTLLLIAGGGIVVVVILVVLVRSKR
ncbi:MAG: hypothetical protein ACFFE1_11135 [Candidatus Thorarchaeota archaeon]